MVTVIGQHEVKDFTEWKKGFEADEPNRAKEGIKLKGLYQSVKNPNDVTFIFEAPGADVFDAYTSRPELQQAMEDAGVVSVPVFSVLNKVK